MDGGRDSVRRHLDRRRHIGVLRTQPHTASGPAGSLAQPGKQTYRTSGTLEGFDGSPLSDCTFDASQRTIVSGQAIRLYGHIDGREATLFMRDTPAGQPPSLAADGWTEVGKVAVKADGRVVSPWLRPSRTTWYVVRYDGVNGGFVAFTPW